MSYPQFSRNLNPEFFATLKKRVDNYFKENNLNRYGNWPMVWKTLFTFTLYLAPLAIIVFYTPQSLLLIFGLWILAGLGKAAVGLNVMHDANHGSYSSISWVNKIMARSMNLLGGNARIWQVQHNVLHHTFTNVSGHDDDLEGPGFLRFSPHQKKRKIHRYQHIFAWFPYSLMTLQRFVKSDFDQLFRYKREGLLKGSGNLWKEFVLIVFWKLIYIGLFIVLPMVAVPEHWGIMLMGFITMHLIAGLILALIFQTAHIMPQTEFPLPNDSNQIENHWAIHQLQTTLNFAMRSRWFSWLVGGLNFQVEHHLFQNISHVHYRKLSPIVAQTAKEFGLPYHHERTFFGAIQGHARLLKDLGR